MQTQTHVLLALAILAKPGAPLRNWSVIAGALATDIFIYAGFAWHVGIGGQSPGVFFRDTYFQSVMQFWSALSNSLPIFAALAGIGFAAKGKKYGAALMFFALAGFSQSLIDLPVHADDAHRHFWPLSHWRFISPVSYWDPAHYGRITGLLEALLGTACAIVLWRKFTGRVARIVLAFFVLLYAVFAGLSVLSLL